MMDPAEGFVNRTNCVFRISEEIGLSKLVVSKLEILRGQFDPVSLNWAFIAKIKIEAGTDDAQIDT